jgi:hypothetical protein
MIQYSPATTYYLLPITHYPLNFNVMKKSQVVFSILFIIGLVFFNACTTPQKLYEKGNYDEAISEVTKRMHGRKIKEKDIQTLVEAFNYIQAREGERLSRLQAHHTPEMWSEIYNLASRMSHRQDLVKPFLAYDEVKYFGKLQDLYFQNNLASVISESREGASEYLYNKGVENLGRAKNGQRLVARAAYNDFNNINSYNNNYKDAQTLQAEAYAMGINHVYFKVENDSRAFLPRDFEQALEGIFVRDMNSQWVKYHTNKSDNLRYEYSVVARITDIDVSPERVNRNRFREENTIEDGWETVKDAKGNVKKDTLGNEIKQKRFVKVDAEVFEVCQTKEARVRGFLEYVDNRTGERVLSQPIQSNAEFRNKAVRFEGDRRALSTETCNLLGGSPRNFPSDAEMIMLAADDLKSHTKSIVRNNDYVLAK